MPVEFFWIRIEALAKRWLKAIITYSLVSALAVAVAHLSDEYPDEPQTAGDDGHEDITEEPEASVVSPFHVVNPAHLESFQERKKGRRSTSTY
jgi:hypothetical protein